MGISRKQQQQQSASTPSISFGVTKRAACAVKEGKGFWVNTVGEVTITINGQSRTLNAAVLTEGEDLWEAVREIEGLKRLTLYGKFGFTKRPIKDASGSVLTDEEGLPYMQAVFSMDTMTSWEFATFFDKEVTSLSDLDQLVQDQARLQAGLAARKAANTASSSEISEEEAAEAAAALADI